MLRDEQWARVAARDRSNAECSATQQKGHKQRGKQTSISSRERVGGSVALSCAEPVLTQSRDPKSKEPNNNRGPAATAIDCLLIACCVGFWSGGCVDSRGLGVECALSPGVGNAFEVVRSVSRSDGWMIQLTATHDDPPHHAILSLNARPPFLSTPPYTTAPHTLTLPQEAARPTKRRALVAGGLGLSGSRVLAFAPTPR